MKKEVGNDRLNSSSSQKKDERKSSGAQKKEELRRAAQGGRRLRRLNTESVTGKGGFHTKLVEEGRKEQK